ncbi:MAG: M48 family metallopeptidase [Geminicoccales bacterium]
MTACLSALVAAFSILLLAACETAPVTGRRQLILLPEGQAAEMGQAAYADIKSETKVSNDPELNRTVREVGRRIAAVSGQPDLDWEFTVFQDETPNAFALPGGKVGVNAGLFEVAENPHQLAAVMAHEVAHAIAQHSNERISQQILLQTGLVGLQAAGGAQYAQIAADLATLGVVLPFSRSQETEADAIGLVMMARAGYDPRQAIDLWRNFEAYGGDRPPEFLSTHPEPGNRIAELQERMPEALAVYEANPDKVPAPKT